MPERLAAQVAGVLERHLGLSAGSVGPRVIGAAVRARIAATHNPDPETYLRLLNADPREVAELAELVVVPETWFFRYPESFRHLAEWAVARRGGLGLVRPLRLLSVPCSTGEEPYAIAVTLLDAGLAPGMFRVEATDVSQRVVEMAKAGVYGEGAFRETPAGLKARFFDRSGDGYKVRDDVRGAVTFTVGNLADPRFLAGAGAFDVIFCRNLFIYLTADARKAATATIDRLLAPGGVVYMGHAEPLGLFDGRFRSAGRPQAFAFERSLPGTAAVPAAKLPVASPATKHSEILPKQVSVPPTAPAPDAAGTAAVPGPSPLTQARAAADQGDLAAAEALVAEALRSGPSAEAYTLLGVVHATAGDAAGAERAFSRALYLEPGYHDALLHMMVLTENRGDAAAAARYRRRAEAAARREAGR